MVVMGTNHYDSEIGLHGERETIVIDCSAAALPNNAEYLLRSTLRGGAGVAEKRIPHTLLESPIGR